MAINKHVFIHDADKAALQTLKAIPGFTQLLKAFMKVWNERLFRIENMATNLRISSEQLGKYHEMLPPICEKLGIDVPELYLELNLLPNAYTAGDTNPFIVITTGLVESFPERLIPTVLAHECGHIACHHVLYSTMGRMILKGTLNFLPLNIANIAITPIKATFSYWMRCSELSADRAAALCDGTTDKVIEMCMRFAGFPSAHQGTFPEMNVDCFLKQAKDYEMLVDQSAWNKALSFMMFYDTDHPINAVRAYECKKWEESEDFIKAKLYFDAFKNDKKPQDLPISWQEKHFIGRNVHEVEKELLEFGFYDVDLVRCVDKTLFSKENCVINVDIGGTDKYKEGDWVSAETIVEVKYYLPFSEEEVASLHPGDVKITYSAKNLLGKPYQEVEMMLIEMGFQNIITEEIRDIEKENSKSIGKVAAVTIDKSPKFSKGDWISEMAEIKLTYHALL